MTSETDAGPDERVLWVPAEGPPITGADDVTDLVGQAWYQGADVVAVPAARFAPAFFDLRSGVAGAIAQKFVNYRLTLAVVGDVSAYSAASEPLRAWVGESARGSHVWFVADADALATRRSRR